MRAGQRARIAVNSYRIDGGLELKFMPEPHHQAFPGMVNGGIIGTLLDCHNWAPPSL